MMWPTLPEEVVLVAAADAEHRLLVYSMGRCRFAPATFVSSDSGNNAHIAVFSHLSFRLDK